MTIKNIKRVYDHVQQKLNVRGGMVDRSLGVATGESKPSLVKK
jgi:hypothetical protein